MKIQFRDDIVTKVPTCALIENYQDLGRAIRNRDWDLVQVVANCLADTISDYTAVPEHLKITPSGASLVAMDCESGIILGADGRDIRCIAGKAVSETMSAECCQCDTNCLRENGCLPECGRIRLGDGEDQIFDSASGGKSLVFLERLEG